MDGGIHNICIFFLKKRDNHTGSIIQLMPVWHIIIPHPTPPSPTPLLTCKLFVGIYCFHMVHPSLCYILVSECCVCVCVCGGGGGGGGGVCVGGWGGCGSNRHCLLTFLVERSPSLSYLLSQYSKLIYF